MSIVVDKILGDVLMHKHSLRTVISDPASAKEGTIILNTADHKIKIYYNEVWQVLHTLDADNNYNFMDGSNFEFMNGDQFEFMNG